jgi:formylglycine-generating enzyme required for sulfatase activity
LPEQRTLDLLYLPDGGDQVIGNAPFGALQAPVVVPSVAQNLSRRCPPEMVDVKGQFCIDRWEASLVDAVSGRLLSPYYAPEPRKAKAARDQWENQRMNMGSAHARATELPELPDWQTAGHVEAMATSRPGRVPNGYVDGNSAARACERAGKRLCTTEEWTTACRGESNRQFPYGERYEHGVCNVFRETHPAVVLHDDASIGHMDPRLNQVEGPSGPLLHRTGATSRCASVWGKDAIYDMVGNLDEWVDDGDGAFMGGFYARSTRLGCDARISTHPKAYADYSLGVRCCK